MPTTIKFLKELDSNEIFAYFPNENYNERLFGSSQKESYSSNGGHSACSVDYAIQCQVAKSEEYESLLKEMIQIGYNDLVVLNEQITAKFKENSYNEAIDKLDTKDFDAWSEGFSKIENKFKSKNK